MTEQTGRLVRLVKVTKQLLIVASLLAVASTAYAVRTPVANCYLVPFTSLVRIAPGVFVDPSLTAAQRSRLLEDIAASRARITEFLGRCQATPTYIAGTTATLHRFGNPAAGTAATLVTPFTDFVVLGPTGMNVDVISHETVHTELKARTGFLRRMRGVPTWFDEGMAMHVDLRSAYGEDVYQKRTSGGRAAPRLADIDTPSKFAVGAHTNYVTARHEFERWYARVGRDGLLRLLAAVRGGSAVPAF